MEGHREDMEKWIELVGGDNEVKERGDIGESGDDMNVKGRRRLVNVHCRSWHSRRKCLQGLEYCQSLGSRMLFQVIIEQPLHCALAVMLTDGTLDETLFI